MSVLRTRPGPWLKVNQSTARTATALLQPHTSRVCINLAFSRRYMVAACRDPETQIAALLFAGHLCPAEQTS
ncbi:hypothetical protein PZA11_007700 [Diplocarpon coronariae]